MGVGREVLVTGAWVKILTSVLDLEVMDMEVVVHARVRVPTEKTSVEKEEKFASGT